MGMWASQSLSLKLAAWVTVAHLLLLTGAMTIGYCDWRYATIEQVKFDGQNLATVLCSAIEPFLNEPLTNPGYGASHLQEVLDSANRNDFFNGLDIFDTQSGQRLASSTRASRQEVTPGWEKGVREGQTVIRAVPLGATIPKELEFFVPLHTQVALGVEAVHPEAALHFYLPLAVTYERIGLDARKRLLGASISIVGIGVLLFSLLHFYLLKPMRLLAKQAQHLGAGDWSARSLHAYPVTEGNEVDHLVRAFDTMAERIETDITKLALSERRLRESQVRLRQVIDLVPHGIFAKDTQGRFVLVNRAFAAMYGKTVHEIVGRSQREVSSNPAEADTALAEDAEVLHAATASQADTRGVEHFCFERTYLGADGCQRFLHIAKTLLLMPGTNEPTVLGICVDMTQQKTLEEERRALDRQIQETQRLESLGILAGGIAHDFNNLLTGMLGHASLIREELGVYHPADEQLQQIEKAGMAAADLCKQMLAYAGKGRLHMVPLGLSRLLNETIGLVHASISKKARLHCALHSSLPPVLADSAQMRQVLMNLVINASEALGGREGTLTLRTTLGTVDSRAWPKNLTGCTLVGPCVIVEVRDTGEGMSQATLDRIFEPFFTTKFAGRGLGLAAVLGIVRGHGGLLDVQSQVGQGTTFTLYLPPAPIAEPTLPTTSPAASSLGLSPLGLAAGGQALNGGTILLIDDKVATRTMTERLLGSIGFAVVAVASGRAARAWLAEHAPEARLVLLDTSLRETEGSDLINYLGGEYPHLRLLLLSDYPEDELTFRPQTRGTIGFLQKPFRRHELLASIQGLLAATPPRTRVGNTSFP